MRLGMRLGNLLKLVLRLDVCLLQAKGLCSGSEIKFQSPLLRLRLGVKYEARPSVRLTSLWPVAFYAFWSSYKHTYEFGSRHTRAHTSFGTHISAHMSFGAYTSTYKRTNQRSYVRFLLRGPLCLFTRGTSQGNLTGTDNRSSHLGTHKQMNARWTIPRSQTVDSFNKSNPRS